MGGEKAQLAREWRLSASKVKALMQSFKVHFHPPWPAERICDPYAIPWAGKLTPKELFLNGGPKSVTQIIYSLTQGVKRGCKIGQKGIAPSCNNLWTKLMKSFVPFCCSWVTNIRNSSSRNKYDWFDASPPEEIEPVFLLPAPFIPDLRKEP